MKKKLLVLVTLCLCVLLCTSCAEVTNVQQCLPGDPYGFWGGLWHGLIAPISFIGSLFSDNIAVWAVNNNGAWYSLGFLIGIGGLFRGIFRFFWEVEKRLSLWLTHRLRCVFLLCGNI